MGDFNGYGAAAKGGDDAFFVISRTEETRVTKDLLCLVVA